MQKDLNKLTEREKCELGMLYDANYSEETVKLRLKCQELCYDFNQIRPSDLKKQEEQIQAPATRFHWNCHCPRL